MSATRRTVLRSGLVAGAVAAAWPRRSNAQSEPPPNKTLRAVMHADLRVFDPIWTTANISGYHGAMIYDMLFNVDEEFAPQPQMIGKWSLSEDKKLYTFELRDGLGWHDGMPVTAADCVASIRRWAQVDGGGQAIMERAKDISKKDDRTFIIALKEPFGPLIDQLAKPITSDWRRVITRRAMKAPATPTIPIVTRSVLQPIRPTATRPGTAGLRAMSSRRCGLSGRTPRRSRSVRRWGGKCSKCSGISSRPYFLAVSCDLSPTGPTRRAGSACRRLSRSGTSKKPDATTWEPT